LIAGNVPSLGALYEVARRGQEYCHRLIETCAPAAAYLTGAAGMNEGNPDNLRVMMEAVKEYGVYKNNSNLKSKKSKTQIKT